MNWVFCEFDEDRSPAKGFLIFWFRFKVFKFEFTEFLKLEKFLLDVSFSLDYLFDIDVLT